MKTDYDVIIAGGGMAGLITASAIGYYSKKAARVLVVDRNPPEEAGKKTNNGWTCGDATSLNSLNFLEKNIGIKYQSPELEHPVKGVLVYSPDHKTKVRFEGEGYILNRKLVPQRQVSDAKGFGVEFNFNVSADRLLSENGYVTGVTGRKGNGEAFKATAKIVIDATGSSSVLRKFLPIQSNIEKEIDMDDIEATGRYIMDFDPGKEDETYFTPDYCLIHLDQFIAPAGYAWVFPKGKNRVNIGLGVSKSGLTRRNKKFKLGDNLQSLIDKYVKDNPAIKNARLSTGPGYDGNAKGNWQVPVRRHNDCMVANGFVVVGDAAWMPRPLDAGGIGPSMYASVILGKVVVQSLQSNDFSQEALWGYNVEYMTTHGYQMASFEVLRRYLQTLTNEQINYGMKHFLSEEDVRAIGERRHPDFNRTQMMNPILLLRALSEYDLAKGLRYTAKKSQTLVQHNLAYPTSPKGFADWKKTLLKEIDETTERFKPIEVAGELPKSLDDDIVAVWQELSPSGAYLLGWNEFAGMLFIPSEQNVKEALEKVRALRRRAENDVQAKVLDSIEVGLLLPEPQPVLDDIIGSIFVHLTKEGVNDKHLASLIAGSSKALDATQKRFKGVKVPSAVKALALYRLDGVLEILASVKRVTKSKKLKEDCDRLAEKVRKFVAQYELEGFGKGTFEEVEKVFQKQKFALGREKFYRAALEGGFDYDETPDQLEEKALKWIDDELPRYRDVIRRLAKHYGCEATPDAVQRKVIERQKLKPHQLLRVTNSIRKVVQAFADESVVRINKNYKTKVIETPPYLTGTMPTGAAMFFDTFTKKPFQVYFLTTDPKRNPPKSVSQLINLLVHEEYGHCVNHSNSVLGPGARPSQIELINSLLVGPVSEGLSFNREREFMEASLALQGKESLSKAERNYIALLDKHGGFDLLNMELEFETRKYRLIRFLRVVGDVRINTNKQGLFEFIDWANKYTGVERGNVYYNLFPAHEGMFPGYATCYAVVGEEIHEIEKRLTDAKKRIKFSTYLTGIGFPPRSVYRQRLEDFAASLE